MACQSEKFSERKSRAEQDWDGDLFSGGVAPAKIQGGAFYANFATAA